jgi:hypothetical protein
MPACRASKPVRWPAAATPAEEVQGALHRAKPETFAAFDDPYRMAERLERERSAHRRRSTAT